MSDGAIIRTTWVTWGHAATLLTMLAMGAAALVKISTLSYEVGTIQTTLEMGLKNESILRQADKEAVNERLDAQNRVMLQTSSDVRELRSYMLVKGQFPESGKR